MAFEYAIFGSSFDPPHVGHKMIVSALAKKFKQVDVIPTYNHLQKNTTAPYAHRVAMAEILTWEFLNVDVSSVEKDFCDLTEGSTYKLLKILAEDEIYPYLVIGYDLVSNKK